MCTSSLDVNLPKLTTHLCNIRPENHTFTRNFVVIQLVDFIDQKHKQSRAPSTRECRARGCYPAHLISLATCLTHWVDATQKQERVCFPRVPLFFTYFTPHNMPLRESRLRTVKLGCVDPYARTFSGHSALSLGDMSNLLRRWSVVSACLTV